VAARAELVERTEQAYALGVPTLVCGDAVFFGNGRLDLLL
jgi:2-hydroxychromene-2-carboxylate isomerase